MLRLVLRLLLALTLVGCSADALDSAALPFGVRGDAEVFGGDQDARVGVSLAGALDVNGDGYDDVIGGSHTWDAANDPARGTAHLWLGGPGGLTDSGWSPDLDSFPAGSQLGLVVAGGADVNGDGRPDVVLGAPGYSDTLDRQGRACLYLAEGASLATEPAWCAQGGEDLEALGSALAFVGDLDGDGGSELLIGSPGCHGDDCPQPNGYAILYFSTSSGFESTPRRVIQGDAFGYRLGASVAGLGDFDGDGRPDVAIGIPNHGGGDGAVDVYGGLADGLTSDPIAHLEHSDGPGSLFGSAVAGPGDVDGDGFADLLIGAPWWGEACRCGWVGLRAGGPSLGQDELWAQESEQDGSMLGATVSAAGDLDGDGHADFASAAPVWLEGSEGEGAVDVQRGSPDGVVAWSAWGAFGQQTAARLGSALAAAGDVDGDGFADLVVGAEGRSEGFVGEGSVRLVRGGPSPMSSSLTTLIDGTLEWASLGEALDSAGDLNGDGFGDFAVGEPDVDFGGPGTGRVHLYYGRGGGLGEPDQVLDGQAEDQLGHGLGGGGDVNGDGYDDLLIERGGNFSVPPAVALHLGGSQGLANAASWVAEHPDGDVVEQSLSSSLTAALGDLDGDGFADIVIGTPDFENGGGLVEVWRGGPDGPADAPDWSTSAQSGWYGFIVAADGDFDGDGRNDLVVGSPGPWREWEDPLPWEPALIEVWYGTPDLRDLGDPGWSASLPASGQSWFWALSAGGDVNGDGRSELLLGDVVFEDRGRSLLWFGGEGGLDDAPESFEPAPGFGWGIGVSAELDLDANGRSDLVIASGDEQSSSCPVFENNGQLFVFLDGRLPGPSFDQQICSNQDNESLGQRLASAGDVDGDGFTELLVGTTEAAGGNTRTVYLAWGNDDGTLPLAPARVRATTRDDQPIAFGGSTRDAGGFRIHALARTPFPGTPVALQAEVKPLGTPFDGTDLLLGDWADVDGDGDELSLDISGLREGTAFHWRVRVLAAQEAAAPMTAGRWHWPRPGVAPHGVHLRTPCLDDDDGDGRCDNDQDDDGDGLTENEGDCDDTDPNAFPGATESCDDEVDQDCDGAESLVDQDPDCWPGDCACATGSRGGGALLLLLPLVWRRRRAPGGAGARAPREADPEAGVLRGAGQEATAVRSTAPLLLVAPLLLITSLVPPSALAGPLDPLRAADEAEPTTWAAWSARAQAFEAVGRPDIAAELLRAGRELLGGTAKIEAEIKRLEALPSLDPAATEPPAAAPLEAAVATALQAGRCHGARAAALQLTFWRPTVPGGWALLGDANRCMGSTRGAVLAYRRYQEAGGSAAAIREVLDLLALQLASVEVTVVLPDEARDPVVTLRIDGAELTAVGSAVSFDDLPTGQELSVQVAGTGLETTSAPVPPLPPGAREPIELQPSWFGVAMVTIAEHAPEECSTWLVTDAGRVPAPPGSTIAVTAGRVRAEMESPLGASAVDLPVEPGAEVPFDPRLHLPAALTLSGLPAGAEVRLFLEGTGGAESERSFVLDPQVGDIDPTTGVRLAPPTTVPSLHGGAGGLWVTHPSLGAGTGNLVLASGRDNAMAFDFRSLEGVPAVQARWEQWRTQRAAANAAANGARVHGVLGGVLLGAGGGLLAGGFAARASSIEARTAAIEHLAGGGSDAELLQEQADANSSGDTAFKVLLGTGSAALTAGVVQIVIAAVRGSQSAGASMDDDWDPAGADVE